MWLITTRRVFGPIASRTAGPLVDRFFRGRANDLDLDAGLAAQL
jgi:hypothetical protein